MYKKCIKDVKETLLKFIRENKKAEFSCIDREMRILAQGCVFAIF